MDRSITDFNIRLRTIRIRELALCIITSIIIVGVLCAIFPIIYENDDLLFITLLSLVLIFFIWALKGTDGLGKNFENLFLPENRKEILYVFALNIIFAFIFTCLMGWLDLFVGFGEPNWISFYDIDSTNISAGAFLLSAISSIIFAPVFEELVFRGVLFNRMKISIGIIPAMIVSSFLFAIGHDFGGILSAFLFGICMCILYLKTDNILIPMSVHFINNITATILELTPIDSIAGQLPGLIPATIIILITTIFLIKYIVQESSALKEKFS